jgi:hypothetical protein
VRPQKANIFDPATNRIGCCGHCRDRTSCAECRVSVLNRFPRPALYARHMPVMKRQHYCGQAGPPRPRCQRQRSLYSPRCRNCVAHECRDRQQDRNILLSNRFSGGSLRVVVARAPRDLRPPKRVVVVTMMQPVRPCARCRLLRT